ncbi:hypothetical protein Tco_1477261 [Tanacetum coccineum]
MKSPEVKKSVDVLIIHDDDEEKESTRDALIRRKRENGKGMQEIRDSPLPKPIRYPRTHIDLISSDMETLQELTVSAQDAPSSSDKETLKELTASDPTPSSSTPKTKQDRFKHYKNVIFLMSRRYGYMFKHMKRSFMPRKEFREMETGLKSTIKQVLHSMVDERVNEIAKKTMPLYVAGGLLLDRQKIQTDMANMIAEA